MPGQSSQQGLREHRKVFELLRDRIQTGEWGPGTKLPGRIKIARDLGVGVSTVERAMAPLVAQGLLVVDDRSGTYVASGLAPDPLAKHSALGPAARFGDAPRVPVGLVVAGGLRNRRIETVILSIETRLAAENVMLVRPNQLVSIDPGLSAGQLASTLARFGCEALVVISLYEDAGFVRDFLEDAKGMHSPVVFVTAYDVQGPVSVTHYSRFDAGYAAASHLFSQGWTRLGFVGHSRVGWARERLEGASRAVETLSGGGALDVRFALDADIDIDLEDPSMAQCIEWGRRATRQLLDANPTLDGLIAANDCAALGAIRAVTELGLQPGIDIGIIGFDDDDIASIEGITTLRSPLDELGEEAARLVLRRMAGDGRASAVRLQAKLVVRLSSCKPAALKFGAARRT